MKESNAARNVCFFAILISAGANNSNTDHENDMWKTASFPLYHATIGRQRF